MAWEPMGMFGWSQKQEKEPCKTEACLIQECLSKNDFQHDKCKSQIDKLKRCCSECQVRSSLSHHIIVIGDVLGRHSRPPQGHGSGIEACILPKQGCV